MIADLYRPGRSILHRSPAGAKLAVLALIGTALFLVPNLWLSLGAFAAALTASAAILGRGPTVRSLRALLPVVLLVGGFQLWVAGWAVAALFAARLGALLILAVLVSATTRPSAIAAAIEHGLAPLLRPLGVDPARIGLAFGLAIRFVPVLAGVAAEIREAQAARGLDRSVLALAVPLVLRSLKMADEIAEAIDARS